MWLHKDAYDDIFGVALCALHWCIQRVYSLGRQARVIFENFNVIGIDHCNGPCPKVIQQPDSITQQCWALKPLWFSIWRWWPSRIPWTHVHGPFIRVHFEDGHALSMRTCYTTSWQTCSVFWAGIKWQCYFNGREYVNPTRTVFSLPVHHNTTRDVLRKYSCLRAGCVSAGRQPV